MSVESVGAKTAFRLAFAGSPASEYGELKYVTEGQYVITTIAIRGSTETRVIRIQASTVVDRECINRTSYSESDTPSSEARQLVVLPGLLLLLLRDMHGRPRVSAA